MAEKVRKVPADRCFSIRSLWKNKILCRLSAKWTFLAFVLSVAKGEKQALLIACPVTSPLWSRVVATSPCRGAFGWDRTLFKLGGSLIGGGGGEILIHRGGLETALSLWMFLSDPARSNIFFFFSLSHSGFEVSVDCNWKKKIFFFCCKAVTENVNNWRSENFPTLLQTDCRMLVWQIVYIHFIFIIVQCCVSCCLFFQVDLIKSTNVCECCR